MLNVGPSEGGGFPPRHLTYLTFNISPVLSTFFEGPKTDLTYLTFPLF